MPAERYRCASNPFNIDSFLMSIFFFADNSVTLTRLKIDFDKKKNPYCDDTSMVKEYYKHNDSKLKKRTFAHFYLIDFIFFFFYNKTPLLLQTDGGDNVKNQDIDGAP